MKSLLLIAVALLASQITGPVGCKDNAASTPSPAKKSDSASAANPPVSSCTRLSKKVCGPATQCSAAVSSAIARAKDETCARWLDDGPLTKAFERAAAAPRALPKPCDQLVAAACKVAPIICPDIRSVISDTSGAADEEATCRKVLSSPRLMEVFAQRLAIIEFARSIDPVDNEQP